MTLQHTGICRPGCIAMGRTLEEAIRVKRSEMSFMLKSEKWSCSAGSMDVQIVPEVQLKVEYLRFLH